MNPFAKICNRSHKKKSREIINKNKKKVGGCHPLTVFLLILAGIDSDVSCCMMEFNDKTIASLQDKGLFASEVRRNAAQLHQQVRSAVAEIGAATLPKDALRDVDIGAVLALR